MKVLIVSHPCATAANQAVFAEIVRATGWDIRLVIPAGWRDEFGNSLDQNAWPGLEGRVDRVPVIFNGNIILHIYRKAWGAYLGREGFDVIYMHHEPYAAATGQVCFANSRLKSPAAFGFYSAQNIRKSYPAPFSWIERFVHRSSRFAFPVSQTVAAVLAAKNTLARCTVCPLPIDPTVCYARTADAPLLPHAAGEAVIGYVGRLVESKGLGTLASALALLKDCAWKLHVIGTGDGQLAFERLLSQGGIRDRVTFHAFVPHLRIPEYLSAMDLLVVPSETQPAWKEQFGRVIVEAMACGTPVVGSDSGEIPVLISSSGGGLVFPERDAPALAAAIRTMAGQPQLRTDLARSGRKWVLENGTVEVVARRMADAMEEAAI
jgi:glycosyltransferase involved in cell wall biosynthesis